MKIIRELLIVYSCIRDINQILDSISSMPIQCDIQKGYYIWLSKIRRMQCEGSVDYKIRDLDVRIKYSFDSLPENVREAISLAMELEVNLDLSKLRKIAVRL